MSCTDVINIVAILTAPIIALIVGQYLQEKSKKRADKMEVFKTLMSSRVYGWTTQSVYALNTIDIVFSDDKKVRNQWKIYYDKLYVENPTETELAKIKTEQYKLIEEIASSLGYKDKITWETIQNPYIPNGLINSMTQQQSFQNNQAEVMELMKSMIPMPKTEEQTNG